MTEREAISLMTAILMTTISYNDDDEETILSDPRERVLDAVYLAEMIWDEAGMRCITRQAADQADPAA